MDKLFLYVSCLILGGAGAWFISRWGKTFGLLDKANSRSSHKGFVPKGGGIGILAAFLVSSVGLVAPAIFWISSLFISLCSLWGDRSEIRPKTRLLFQFAAGIVIVAGILCQKDSGLAGYFLVPPLAIFVVGTANYYNFMDGINGIAGITGVVGFGLVAWFVSVQRADPMFLSLCVCIGLACLGFLPFNIPKAKVFMGDVGSILLGFVFAGMVVLLSKSFLDFIVLTSFLFPFYADELSTTLVRLRNGENLLRPHRRHLYQLLANEMGFSHWKISLAYGMVQLIAGATILLMRSYGSLIILATLTVYFGGFLFFNTSIRKKLVTTV